MAQDGAAQFRRRGQVSAQQLDGPKQWRTEGGDVLQAQAGDWWVVSDDGVGRSVTPDEFQISYTLASPGRYRRVGIVTARQAEDREVVETLEGPATAEPGMWVVTGPNGNSWPVPDDVFRRGYEPLQG